LTGLRAPALERRACALTENADIESVAIILVQSTQPPRCFSFLVSVYPLSPPRAIDRCVVRVAELLRTRRCAAVSFGPMWSQTR
jgi:hypothetical protein